jgi:RNase P subunit RPR2
MAGDTPVNKIKWHTCKICVETIDIDFFVISKNEQTITCPACGEKYTFIEGGTNE